MSQIPLARLDKDVAQWGMLTQDQLAERLRHVNVEEVAREAGVSTKTIYRLRHKTHAPRIDLAERIVAAIERIEVRAKAPAQQAAA